MIYNPSRVVVSPHSFSALHHAALTGTTELLSLLLEAQATVDIKDINGTLTSRTNVTTQTQHSGTEMFPFEESVGVKWSLKTSSTAF